MAGIAFIASAAMALAADQAVISPGPLAKIYDWTGLYLGLNGDGAFGTAHWSSVANLISGTSTVSGGLVAGTAGYNLQTGEPCVVGVEADLDWSGVQGTTKWNIYTSI